MVDAIRSESCDDGNVLSHDGCSSRCAVETPRWTTTLFTSRLARYGVAIAFDARRGRLVTFGGSGPAPQNGTRYVQEAFEWAGAWTELHPRSSPSARAQSGLAYDETRGVIVLFGGQNGSYLADTWLWNGSEWTAADAQGPPARYAPAMTYDPINDRTVMFGGSDKGGPRRDTWQLQAGQWTQLPDGPQDAQYASMTFDGTTGRIAVAVDDGYYELDGGVWTNLGALPAAMIQGPHWIVYEGATQAAPAPRRAERWGAAHLGAGRAELDGSDALDAACRIRHWRDH